MATLTPRGQRGITLIEIVLWCAIVAAAVAAVFMFGKNASVTAAVETEQRQVEDIVKTVDSIFATQPNFAALGSNGAVYLRERAARSGLKFQINDDGDPILTTGLGAGSLTLSSWDAVPPTGPAVANSGYRLAYQGLAASECAKLVTATYPIAYQVSAGHDGLNDVVATNLATRGQMTVSPAVIARNCAAPDGAATVFLYFYPARAIAGTPTPTPAPAARCNPVHETQNLACPVGQMGTITQERDGTCTGPGNTIVYTVWATTNDTCQDPPVTPPSVTPPTTPDDCAITTYTQALACPLGQIGQVTQERQHDTCAGTYTPWVTASNSCQPQPPAATCTPSMQAQVLPCPAGQGGQIVQHQSSTCAFPTAVPAWSGWMTVSNTCTTSCDQGGNSCCTVQRRTQPGPVCAAGTYGTAGEQESFLGCLTPQTQAGSWTPWQDVTSGNCTACPPTTTETNTQWVNRTGACASGMTGSITYEAEQVQTRDVSYNCPAATPTLPAPTYTAWTAWSDTGATRNVVDTCVVPPASDCLIPAGTTFNWTQGVAPLIRACSYTAPAALNVADGASLNVEDITLNDVGRASFACAAATLDPSTPLPGATCVAACINSTNTAAITRPATPEVRTVACPSGYTGLITQERPLVQAGTRYTERRCASIFGPQTVTTRDVWRTVYTYTGPWSEVSNTCVPAPACVAPANSTQTETANVSCPVGQVLVSGTTEFTQSRTRAITYSCPAPTGAYAVNQGPWSAWTPAVASVCSNACEAPPSTTETQTLSCPSGEAGSILQSRTLSYHCPTPTGSPVATTGPWTTVTNSCVPATCSGPSSETQWLSTTGSCSAGYWGLPSWEREQVRSRTCNTGTWTAWGAWADTGNTRNPTNPCTACPSNFTEPGVQWLSTNGSCPSGQAGAHTWEREQSRSRPVTYSCPAGTTSAPSASYGSWGAWADTGNRRNEVNTCAPKHCYVLIEHYSTTFDASDAFYSINYTANGTSGGCFASRRDNGPNGFADCSAGSNGVWHLATWAASALDGDTYATDGSQAGWQQANGDFWTSDYQRYERRSGASCP